MLLFVPIIGPFLALGIATTALTVVTGTINIFFMLGPLSVINTLNPSGLIGAILMALAF